MIQSNKIHYAVKISTGTTIDNPSIGLYAGEFRYVTGGYENSPLDIYEDMNPVTGNWEKHLLNIDGIKTSAQSIDIVIGGDYSFLSSLSIELVNAGSIHESILATEGLLTGGASMKMYTIIDKTWYDTWSGVVTEATFNEDKFIFTGKDRNNTDNNTITDAVFGYNNTTYTTIETDTDSIIDNITIRNYKTIETNDQWKSFANYNQTWVGSKSYEGDDWMRTFYVGSHPHGKYYPANTNTVEYIVELNGHYSNIKKGMYIQVAGDEILYLITSDPELLTEKDYYNKDYQFTKLKVDQEITSLTDYDQFYGHQALNVSSTIETATEKFTEQTAHCSIYNKGLWIKPLPNGESYDVVDGKLKAISKDGDVFYLEVIENDDKSLTITRTTYSSILFPIKDKIRYYSDNDDNLFTTALNNGSMKHLETFGSAPSSNIPQDLNETDTFFVGNVNKNHYFMLEFDSDIEGYTPFVIVNGLVDARESWGEFYSFGSLVIATYIWSNSSAPAGWIPSAYYSPYINSDDKTIDSFYRNFSLTTYAVYNDLTFGEVPLVDADAETSLPNLRSKTGYTKDDFTDNNDWSVTVNSVTTTNLPREDLKGNAVSVNTGLMNQSGSYDSSIGRYNLFPYGLITEFEADQPKITKSSNKLMLKISNGAADANSGDDGNMAIKYSASSYSTARQINYSNFIFGLNSIGLYKTIIIETLEDFSIATTNEGTDTYPELLSELSGTTVTLPSRGSWFVGAQITDEVNTFEEVTKLCKQGFVGGWTNRHGDVKFSAFLEDNTTKHTFEN